MAIKPWYAIYPVSYFDKFDLPIWGSTSNFSDFRFSARGLSLRINPKKHLE